MDQQPDFDGVHVLSTDCPQLYRRIRRQVLEAFTPLRCVDVRFDLPAPPMNGRRFQAASAVGQLLLSARTADLPEDGETLNSDDDDDDDDDDGLP